MKPLLHRASCLIALSILFACTSSQSETEKSDETTTQEEKFSYIDATIAAADNYKLLSTDDSVRVVEMRLDPGQRDKKHSHMRETAYFITGGQLKIHVGDDVVEADIPDGHVMHHKPWTHSVENTGETTIHAIVFERMGQTTVDPLEGYIDATQAASDHYTLLSDEGGVRVIHMLLGPGEQDNLHSHARETVYFISGGKAKIHVGDDVVDADIPDGHVMHHGPWTHSVENVGDTQIEAIIFEQMPGVE